MTTVTGSPGHLPADGEPGAGEPAEQTVPSEARGASGAGDRSPVTSATGDAEPVEHEVGALVVRVAQLTQDLLEEARHQAQRIVAEARAEATLMVAEAQRQADGVRADARERDPALRQIQAAIETLERVRYELSRAPDGAVPSSAPAPGEGQTDAGSSFVNASNKT